MVCCRGIIKTMQKRKLEHYRIFPIVAWVLVIGFAYFVFTLTIQLSQTANSYQEQKTKLEDAVHRGILPTNQ